jgi:hypothetical protein
VKPVAEVLEYHQDLHFLEEKLLRHNNDQHSRGALMLPQVVAKQYDAPSWHHSITNSLFATV